MAISGQSVNAPTARCWLQIDAVNQVIERTLIDEPRDITLERRFRNPKRGGIKSLVEDADSGAITKNDLHGGAAPSEEDKQRT